MREPGPMQVRRGFGAAPKLRVLAWGRRPGAEPEGGKPTRRGRRGERETEGDDEAQRGGARFGSQRLSIDLAAARIRIQNRDVAGVVSPRANA